MGWDTVLTQEQLQSPSSLDLEWNHTHAPTLFIYDDYDNDDGVDDHTTNYNYDN